MYSNNIIDEQKALDKEKETEKDTDKEKETNNVKVTLTELINFTHNLNPTYKINFAYTNTFPFLSITYSTIFSSFYNPQTVPLAATVTTLSQYQALKYNTQIQLFHKVYATNSNAYINYIATGKSPNYYTFLTYTEKNDYNAAVQLINKLYPFQDMATAANWIVPFPISM